MNGVMEEVEMEDHDVYLSPWYRVLSPEGKFLFEIRFYRDPSELGPGFTFDAYECDWICRKFDQDNLTIYAETMGSYMIRSIDRYHKELGEETPDDVSYGYIEMG